MKSKMKMMMILPIIFAATVGLYDQSSENSKNTPSQKEMLQVKVTYLEEEKKIPNADVYFLYYDEAASTLVEKTANTGSGKTLNFQVPVTSGGASYAFVVFFSKEEVEKAKEELEKGNNLMMFCRPSGETCESLELRIQKNGTIGNEGCAIQMVIK